MLYLAIDQHASQLTINLRDEGGDVIRCRQVSTRPPLVQRFLEELRRESEAEGGYMSIVEVSGFNDWLLELLRECGCREIVLVQPERRGRQKTDRRDAKELGETLWVNRQRILAGQSIHGLRRVHIAEHQEQEDRRLTAMRQRVAQERTRVINRVKHLLRRRNLQHECPTKGVKTKQAWRWLKTLALPELDRMELDHLLAQWELLDRHLGTLQKHIVGRQAASPRAQVLDTIPGAAAFASLALGCRVGPIERFARPGSLANYFGLAPGINDSGETRGRIGSITKRGSATARFLLSQLVVHVVRVDRRMREWYRAIKKRRGPRIARVAVMRRLATIIWRMLKYGVAYEVASVPPR